MSKRAFSRSFDMPTVDPDKEDEFIIDMPDDVEIDWEALAKQVLIPKSGTIIYAGTPSKAVCPVVAKSCDHKWKNYTGLSEKFEYCEICDERK